jgi:hypothetical protein
VGEVDEGAVVVGIVEVEAYQGGVGGLHVWVDGYELVGFVGAGVRW